jgi:hypothetical protein
VRQKAVTVLLAAVLAVVPKWSQTKVGWLVGVSIQEPLGDALRGQSDNATYLGSVYVRLGDNTEVQAVCEAKLLHTLRGGQRIEIEPLDGKVKWKVVRALDYDQ